MRLSTRVLQATVLLTVLWIALPCGAAPPSPGEEVTVKEVGRHRATGQQLQLPGTDGNLIEGAGLAGAVSAPAGSRGTVGPLVRLWRSFTNTPLVRRIRDVGRWIGSFLRLLWTIPKALFQGDSQAMIEALGDLLSQGAEAEARPAPDAVETGDGELEGRLQPDETEPERIGN